VSDIRAQALMDQLAAELGGRGLSVTVNLPTLTVKAPIVSTRDPQVLQVLLRHYEERGLTWCWVWPGFPPAERDGLTSEVEPACPASEITLAANLITNAVCGTPGPLEASATFDPERVKTAAVLQASCPGWHIFWSPGLREFTAIAMFIPDQAVVLSSPFTYSLLKRISAVEMAAITQPSVERAMEAPAKSWTVLGRPVRSIESSRPTAGRLSPRGDVSGRAASHTRAAEPSFRRRQHPTDRWMP
jgi:hypothetical protein